MNLNYYFGSTPRCFNKPRCQNSSCDAYASIARCTQCSVRHTLFSSVVKYIDCCSCYAGSQLHLLGCKRTQNWNLRCKLVLLAARSIFISFTSASSVTPMSGHWYWVHVSLYGVSARAQLLKGSLGVHVCGDTCNWFKGRINFFFLFMFILCGILC